MQSGRCLCGEVQYEVDGELPPLVNCHCQFCRRAHGAAFVTIAWVPRSRLRWIAGSERVKRYEVGDGYRAFCSSCGTRIYNGTNDEQGFITLIVSTLDDPSLAGPVLHLNVESKAPWHEIVDELPQFEDFSSQVIEELERNR